VVAIVDGSLDSPAGAYCSLAFDSSNYPHISYKDTKNGGLKYAWKDGTGWHNVTVDPARRAGDYTSLVLDGNNTPHISYSTESSLYYASVNDSAWFTQLVDRRATMWTSIDVDSKNRPRIASYDARNGDLRFSWWEPSIRGRPFPRD
jgi:hypothetical protein